MTKKEPSAAARYHSWIIWGVALVGLVLLATAFSQAWAVNRALRREGARFAPMLDAVVEENAALEQELQYVQSVEYVARWAQAHARMTRGNEVLVVPLQATPTPTPVPPLEPLSESPTTSEPFWRGWWRALTGD